MRAYGSLKQIINRLMYIPISKHLKFLSKTKKERYVFLYGSKRSGKTYSILFWLLLNAIKKLKYKKYINEHQDFLAQKKNNSLFKAVNCNNNLNTFV